MHTTRDEGPGGQPDPEINVTHFIPSVQLKGTRADKLEKLDLLIAHLEGLRRSLAERQEPPAEWRVAPSMQMTRADRWWGAGLLIAAAVVLVLLGARACAGTNEDGASVRHPRPRMARLLPSMTARVQFRRPFDDRDNGNGKFPHAGVNYSIHACQPIEVLTDSLPRIERLVTAMTATVIV